MPEISTGRCHHLGERDGRIQIGIDMTDDIHSCSYYCDQPECIRAQRDELRDRLEVMQAEMAELRKINELAWRAYEDEHADNFRLLLGCNCAEGPK